MRLNIDVTMHYGFTQANTVFLALEAAHTDGQEIAEEWITFGDATIDRITGDSGVGQRVWARVPGNEMYLTYQAKVDVTRKNVPLDSLSAVPIHQLPSEVAPYLRPSRYVQSDKFVAFVGKRFGDLTGGAKVAAIRDWIGRYPKDRLGRHVATNQIVEVIDEDSATGSSYAIVFREPAPREGVISDRVTPRASSQSVSRSSSAQLFEPSPGVTSYQSISSPTQNSDCSRSSANSARVLLSATNGTLRSSAL